MPVTIRRKGWFMSLITRDFLLKNRHLKRERVAFPELGEGIEMIITELSAGAAVEFSEAASGGKGNPADLAVRCLVDETGERLFKDEEAGELASRLSVVVLNKIAATTLRLSGFNRTDEDQEKN